MIKTGAGRPAAQLLLAARDHGDHAGAARDRPGPAGARDRHRHRLQRRADVATWSGERGPVVTVDIDADLVGKARANLAARRATPACILVCGDGGFGAPGHAPYDRIIVTAGAWDLAPDWLAQLGPGGRIVLPLSVRGIQLCVALERGDGHWRSRSACRCGFIRMAGAFAEPEPFAARSGRSPGCTSRPTTGGRWTPARSTPRWPTRPPTCRPACRSSGLGELGEADLWLTITEPDLVRLTITGRGASCGARCCRWCRWGAGRAPPGRPRASRGRGSSGWPRCCRPGRRRAGRAPPGGFEVVVRGFGARGPRLAAAAGRAGAGLGRSWAGPARRA